MPTTGWWVDSSRNSRGSTSAARVHEYAGFAEYHSLRSPGPSSTRWCSGTVPAPVRAAQYCGRDASRSYSGPSCATRTRSVAVAGDQIRADTSLFKAGAGMVSSRHEPSAAGQESQPGGAYSGHSSTDLSPKAPPTRRGLSGSQTTSLPPSWPRRSSSYSSRQSAGRATVSCQTPSRST